MSGYKKLTLISDRIFAIIVIFLFCFLWSKFLFSNYLIALIVCVVLTSIFSLTIFYFSGLKTNKKVDSFLQAKQIENVCNMFYLCSEEKIKSIMQQKLKTEHISTQKCIIDDKEYYYFYKEILFTKHHLLNLIKENLNELEFNVICCEVEQEAQNFALLLENVKVNFIDAKQLVKIFNLKCDKTEFEVKLQSEKKLTIIAFLQLFLKKENAKAYLFSAVILMLSTLVMKYRIYYYVIISILLILSLECKLQIFVNNEKISNKCCIDNKKDV